MTAAERAAHAALLERQKSSVALTLVYNDWPITRERIRRDLRALHAHVDRALLGRRFHRHPENRRSKLWAVIEKLDDFAHVHCGWQVARPFVLRDLIIGGAWTKFAKSGGHNLQVYQSGWATYAVKNLADSADIITSSEFVAMP